MAQSGEVLQSVDCAAEARRVINALARAGIRAYVSRSLSTARCGVVVEVPWSQIYGPTESAVRGALESVLRALELRR